MSNYQNQVKKDFHTDERLKYAQWFVDHGFSIIPIDPQSKKPVISGWQKYSTQHLSDEEKQKFLEMVNGGFNYAITGGQQNLVILDFEDRELLKVWLGEELDKLCKGTLCVVTPHNGLHIYLKVDDVPPHKFNPVFVRDGRGIADLQSFNSYVVAPGSCINHLHCESSKCQWKGQDYKSCYYPLFDYGKEIPLVTITDFKGFLKYLESKGKRLGIELSESAREWVEGKKSSSVEVDLEELKKELAKYNRYAGKTLDAIRKGVCQSIKKNLASAKSKKAKFVLNTAYSVVCEGKTYKDLGLDKDRSGADWYVITVLLSHGVTDIDVIQKLLPPDSKVFAPKWHNYFPETLVKAWKVVKPFVKVVKDAKKKKARELKHEFAEVLSRYIIKEYHIVTYVQRQPVGETIVGIFRWNKKKGVYEPIDETLRKIIRIELARVIDSLPKFEEEGNHKLFEIQSGLVDLIYDEIQDLTLTEYDDDVVPLRVAFENYTLEWLTDNKENNFRLIPADKRSEEHYSFHYIPHKINDEVFKSNMKLPFEINELEELARRVCPKSLEAFKQWVGEKWIVLFELIGYTLYPRIKHKLAFMLLGNRDSGKTTFLNLVKKVLGKNNTVSIRLRELFDPNNRFVTGFLFHKLANLTSETKEYTIEDIDRFKSITGGDQLTSDVKFKGPVTFTPYAKLIVATNKLPNIRDKNDEAFWRRWMIIEFPNQFENDDTWFDRTFTEQEIEGILTVSILAFSRVIRNGKFDYQQTPDEVRDLWLFNTDSVWSFIKTAEKEGVIKIDRTNGDLWVPVKVLYKMYQDYCYEHGYHGVKQKAFTKKLTRYFGIRSAQKFIGRDNYGNEIRERVYVGIGLNIEKFGNGDGKQTQENVTRRDAPYEIRNFEECLGFSTGEIAYQLYNKRIVSEEDLVKIFKNQYDVVKKVEECLPKLNFVDMGNGLFRKQTLEEMYTDFKCTTIWYQRRHEELKGQVKKISELDPDVWLCLKKFNHFEKIDDETIRII